MTVFLVYSLYLRHIFSMDHLDLAEGVELSLLYWAVAHLFAHDGAEV